MSLKPGPWHYRQAEQLMKQLKAARVVGFSEQTLLEAQVHATLALAAAVAATIPDVDVAPDATEWFDSGVLLPEDDDQ